MWSSAIGPGQLDRSGGSSLANYSPGAGGLFKSPSPAGAGWFACWTETHTGRGRWGSCAGRMKTGALAWEAVAGSRVGALCAGTPAQAKSRPARSLSPPSAPAALSSQLTAPIPAAVSLTRPKRSARAPRSATSARLFYLLLAAVEISLAAAPSPALRALGGLRGSCVGRPQAVGKAAGNPQATRTRPVG